jgi:hypothetical protein
LRSQVFREIFVNSSQKHQSWSGLQGQQKSGSKAEAKRKQSGSKAEAKRKRGRHKLKRSPDMVLVLTVAFAVGVLVTLMMPMSPESVAAPASPLQAGIVGPR